MSDSRILIIGESCRDVFHYGDSTRLAPDAPAPIFKPLNATENCGMAMNVQKNIQALGGLCDIITNPNWREVVKSRYIHLNTNQMFLRVDEGDDNIKRLDVKDVDLKNYEAVIISDYCKGFITKEDIDYIASAHPCVFLDTKKTLGPWTKDVNYIKINYHENERSKEFIDRDISNKLIVTSGPYGARFKNRTFSVDRVEIKDTSGAGDTFLAALVVEYVRSKEIEKAIVFANECATRVVQKRGVVVV